MAKRDGCKDIKEHPFYAKHGFDWENFSQRSAFKPPKLIQVNTNGYRRRAS